jgi:phosphoesterase RecJ-like protein
VSLQDAAKWIRERDEFLLTTHAHPDGDGLGSQSALFLALKALGKRVRVVNFHPLPRCYQWLPYAAAVETADRMPSHRHCIVLDVGELHRIREGLTRDELGEVLNIDHHSSGTEFGDVNWVDSTSAATGQMVYRLIRELGVTVDKPIAESIYTTIVTDTGGFRYSNTTPGLLRLAADLMESGADAHIVCDRVFGHVPRAAFELVRRSLATLHTHLDGRIGVMTLSLADFRASGAKDEDTDGLVNYVRKLDGVEVGVFLKERADGRVRVSFRSRNGLDVGVLAAALGGGGHKYASGVNLTCTLQQAVDQVVKLLTETLTHKS